MTKLWLSLGIIDLLVVVGIVVDQKVRFGIWWEWEDFLHHEVYVGIFFYASVIFLIVALIEHRKLKRSRK
jgi:uncharacterized membrane protein